jgi:predicted metal-dependent HD superfamily phosphohydrolase
MPTVARWRSTWQRLGVTPPADEVHAGLIARYQEPHRHYHTTQHLAECFARLDEVDVPIEHAPEVELASWYHDAIYDTHRQDNEAQSAALARSEGGRAGLPEAVLARVDALILATRHDAAPATPDATLLVDVDLAILGAPVERFDEYERQVRTEYAWVPVPLFRSRRREILEGFLSRPRIYGTEAFRATFEDAARANLSRSIRALGV